VPPAQGELVDKLEHADAEVNCKVQPPVAPGGRFATNALDIDLNAGTITCPAGHTVALKPSGEGQIAHFAQACSGCPPAAQRTSPKHGRTIQTRPYESQLARARQSDPGKADYNATRPTVERKISHLTRRKHGGRRARVRGTPKVTADFALLAAAVNLARLATLGLASDHRGSAATTA
jgi:Transposase DDE domain